VSRREQAVGFVATRGVRGPQHIRVRFVAQALLPCFRMHVLTINGSHKKTPSKVLLEFTEEPGTVHSMSADPTNDTHPRVDAILIEGYRRMSPAQKLERVRALTQAVQELAMLDVRRRHPNADAREQALRLASRWIDPDLMVRAFGWDPRVEGY